MAIDRAGQEWPDGEAIPLAEQDRSVCIIDFCGRSKPDNFPTSFSADYFPADRLTYFTGDWGASIPALPCTSEPTEAEAYAGARKHGGEW